MDATWTMFMDIITNSDGKRTKGQADNGMNILWYKEAATISAGPVGCKAGVGSFIDREGQKHLIYSARGQDCVPLCTVQ